MDFDKFRSQWAEPEYRRSQTFPPRQPCSVIIDRVTKMNKRAGRWRAVRQGLLKGSFAAILCLACFRIFVKDSPESGIQTAAYILALAAMGGLNRVDKAREKCGQPRFWLTPGEFMVDEHRRLTEVIPLDRWTSIFISAGIISLALYAAPFLPAAAGPVCWAAAGLAVVILQSYDCRRISQLKHMRDSLGPQPGDQEDNGA
jgi:hypothetical protein